MNLALLDPFHRQIPDRIDSTLSLPRKYHPRRSKLSNHHHQLHSHHPSSTINHLLLSDDIDDGGSNGGNDPNDNPKGMKSSRGRVLRSKLRDGGSSNTSSSRRRKHANNDDDDDDDNNNNNDDKDDEEMDSFDNSCYAVSFNRRGTYLAAGHLSGAMSVHDFASRTLSSIVHPPTKMEPLEKGRRKGGRERDGRGKSRDCGSDDDMEQNARKKKIDNFEEGDGDEERDEDDNNEDDDDDDDDDVEEEEEEEDESQYLENPHIIKTAPVNSQTSSASNNVEKVTSKSSSSSNAQEHTDDDDEDDDNVKNPKYNNVRLFPIGVTSITWSRQSRTCLTASIGDDHVCLVDNSHPYGPNDVSLRMTKDIPTPTTVTNALGNNALNRNHEKIGRASPMVRRSSSPAAAIMNHQNGKDDTNGVGAENYSSTVSVDMNDENLDHYNNKNSNNSNTIKHTNQKSKDVNDAMNDKKDRQNKPILKRTRHISKMEVIDKDDIIRDSSLTDPNFKLMTSLEREVAMKPSSERSADERRIYALMRMRLDGSSKKKKKKKSSKIDNSSINSSIGSNVTDTSSNKANDDHLSSSAKKLKLSHSSEYYHYQKIAIPLPGPIQSSAQIHPNGLGGLACLVDGSLVIFGLTHLNTFCVAKTEEKNKSTPSSSSHSDKGKLFYLNNNSSSSQRKELNAEEKGYFVTCATFDPRGHFVYAATKCGTLLGFQLSSHLQKKIFDRVLPVEKSFVTDDVSDDGPLLRSKIPGGATVNQIICSRNGNMILVNSRDNTLRLYEKKSMQDYIMLHQTKQSQLKPLEPKFSFQDVVSRCKWASCDFSGDGEFIVGGCNNVEAGDKYELYLWNTANGNLLDQLTGPQISLYSLSWHPTRSFIAVGTSDGLVDIWGPRMDWTAFAPDFQALQKNVEYVEKEDEFDVIVDDVDELEKRKKLSNKLEERELVDVTTIDAIPAFDSDSECEENVFYFTSKIRLNYTGK